MTTSLTAATAIRFADRVEASYDRRNAADARTARQGRARRAEDRARRQAAAA